MPNRYTYHETTQQAVNLSHEGMPIVSVGVYF